MRFVVVTGTDTGVGKTVATAALAAAALADGRRVSAVKPYQTGVDSDEPSDVGVVRELSGCDDVHELVRLDEALAPETAARIGGLAIPTVAELVEEIEACAHGRDLTLVEGAGGVAVRLDLQGGTIMTLATLLREQGHDIDIVVVTALHLGTLNHTELTVAALRSVGLEPAGLVIGAVPAVADLGVAERTNLDDLPRLTGLPTIARLPVGAGNMSANAFRAAAPAWISSPRVLG